MRKTEPRVARPSPASTNSPGTLLRRMETGALTWRGPALMLFARAALAVGAQGVVATVFVLNGSPTPWHDAEPWLPVYGTLIDIGCVLLLWRLTRREGIGLLNLVGFQRSRLVRDVLLGLALIPVSLVFIFAGTAAAGWIVYGAPRRRTSWAACHCPMPYMECWCGRSSGGSPSR